MRKCITPDAHFHIHVSSDKASISVTELPITFLTELEAIEIENELHDAVEGVIARHYFNLIQNKG